MSLGYNAFDGKKVNEVLKPISISELKKRFYSKFGELVAMMDTIREMSSFYYMNTNESPSEIHNPSNSEPPATFGGK